MTADVHHVVNPAHEPEVALGVAARAVAGKVSMRELRPIRLYVALIVAPNAAQHSRPWTRQHRVTAPTQRNRFATVVDDVGENAGQRMSRTAGKQRRHAR